MRIGIDENYTRSFTVSLPGDFGVGNATAGGVDLPTTVSLDHLRIQNDHNMRHGKFSSYFSFKLRSRPLVIHFHHGTEHFRCDNPLNIARL